LRPEYALTGKLLTTNITGNLRTLPLTEVVVLFIVCIETDAQKPTKPVEFSGNDKPVPSSEELRRLTDEVKELREALYRLRGQCDRRVKQLQEELDDEKSARQQLVSDFERLKKIVATKLNSL